MYVTGPHTPSFSEELQQARLFNARGSWAVCDVFARKPTSEVGKDWCLSAGELDVGQNFRPSPNFKLFLSLYLQFQKRNVDRI